MIAFSGCSVPISVLAFQWGFSDLSTFNRAFKDRFGFTPSHFRAQLEPLRIPELKAPQPVVTEK
jgi:AraC-like DNA-binding protein